jgi:hypothetical protein
MCYLLSQTRVGIIALTLLSTGEWEFDYSYPEDGAIPRTPAVALPERGDQHASLPDDEPSPLGSPDYVAYAPQLNRSFSGSGSQLPEGLSPGEYSSSTGPRDRHGSMSTSSSISSLTQQFNHLSPPSAGRGYGQISYGGVAMQQNMVDRPGIPPNEGSFQRNYQQPSGYGVGNYGSSSYDQNSFASTKPLGDPYYGRSTQSPQSLGNPAMNTSCKLHLSSTVYYFVPLIENSHPRSNKHIALPGISCPRAAGAISE